jgi:predicted nuclease of predicted toxin-antitoxin system
MQLLFDHNLSHKLVTKLADLFADSSQTGLIGLSIASDFQIWEYAKTHDMVVVSLDSDFFDISLMRGQPPKLIWLRCGNATVAEIENLIRANYSGIKAFLEDPGIACLEIFY